MGLENQDMRWTSRGMKEVNILCFWHKEKENG